MISPAITIEGLSVRYTNGTKALDNINFSLKKGTIAALVGINGSGKSTLFKSIMGFLTPQEGHVSLAGMTPAAAMKKNLVSYVPQSEEIDWNFPVLVEDVVMMGRYGHMNWLRRPKKTDHKKVDEALARVGMSNFSHRQIGELSGGQRKRVFLARSLAQEAPIILLDEPFTGIDVNSEIAIIELLAGLREKGAIVLISTHNLGSVPDFCDQTILINKTILAFGQTEKVFTQSNLEKAFGGQLRRFTLSGEELHNDEDTRSVTVITDDERPFVIYEDKGSPDKETPSS